ncbi:hypothetical protein Glove_410g58 [Diversispora epigaea]|uniref:Uncharacterized protein n=1 Tax=Diversispora epigaea TaxID=1348612 RepID=A0A397H2I5_9GLOM|nr:hypothetical protein Glove_410g58 [Diversispora epigaea]
MVVNYNLPKLLSNVRFELTLKIILKKLNYDITFEKLVKVNTLIDTQCEIFVEIMIYCGEEIFVDQEKTQKIDWCTTFKTLHSSKITNDKTNREDQIKRSFAMKLLNEELPVMTRRFQHQPHIYKDPKCVLCGRYEENNLHVFECKRNNNDPEYKPMIKHYEKLIEYLTDKTYEKTKDISRKTINTILKSISELYLWNIDDQDQRTFHHVNLYDVIRGLIPHSLINKRKDKNNNNNNNNNINREEDNIDTELTKEINRNRDSQIIAREEKKEIERETKKIIERYTVHNLETWIEYGSYYNTNYCYRYLDFI